MASLELGRFGATAEAHDRAATFLDDAAALEKLGYSTIWVAGGQLRTLDSLAELLSATESVGVGSAIIPTEVFPAETVAATYAGLETAHPGRFVVGIGGGHGPRPLRTMASYLDELDRADTPVPASARVLAALGPRKLEMARDRAAGAMALLVTPEYIEDARAVLGTGPALIVQQVVVLDENPDAAREAARGLMRFLTQVPGYPENFRRMGFTDAEVAGLEDRVVDAVVAWGDADAVAARVAELFDAGADQVVPSILPTEASPDVAHTWSVLADKLLR